MPGPERPVTSIAAYRRLKSTIPDSLVLTPALVSWMLAAGTTADTGGIPFAVIGSEPFDNDELIDLLSDLGINVAPASADTEVLIVGRTDWSSLRFKELLDLRAGESLRIYSQEMLLGWLISGRDPFDSKNHETIREIAGEHLALTYFEDVLGFAWPSTIVTPSRLGADGSFDALEIGYLKREGYSVGKTGSPEHKRRQILDHCYRRGVLSRAVFPEYYVEQWGAPGTSIRLHKIAESIASFCRNHQRLSSPSRDAIDDWVSDLRWLKETYYDGKYQFAWPGTEVW